MNSESPQQQLSIHTKFKDSLLAKSVPHMIGAFLGIGLGPIVCRTVSELMGWGSFSIVGGCIGILILAVIGGIAGVFWHLIASSFE